MRFGCYPFVGKVGYGRNADVDILITHLPPAGTMTSIDERGIGWGDPCLREKLIANALRASTSSQ